MEWVRIFMRRGAGCGEPASVTQHKVIVTPQPFLISTVMQVAVVVVAVVVIMQKQSCWCSKHRRIALNAIVVKINQWLIEHQIL